MTDWPVDPACPKCGAHLTRWTQPQGGRTERAAMWTAAHVASGMFPAIVSSAVAGWILVNFLFRPFEPFPVIVWAVLSAALATVAALQAPLILISQRRSAERDRLRDEEAFHATLHNQEDLKRLEAKLDSIIDALAQSNPTKG